MCQRRRRLRTSLDALSLSSERRIHFAGFLFSKRSVSLSPALVIGTVIRPSTLLVSETTGSASASATPTTGLILLILLIFFT